MNWGPGMINDEQIQALSTILRAMALNYEAGHRWDHLDKDAVTKAADVIESLLAGREADKKELIKALAVATQQGNIACELFDEVTSLRRNADDKAPELRAQLVEADARITELEARTLTVKLPKPISVLHRRDFIDAHRAIYAYPEAEVNAALDAAGITLVVGGE